MHHQSRASQTNAPRDAGTSRFLETLLTGAASQLAVADRRTEDAILALGFRAPALIQQLALTPPAGSNSSHSLANLARALEDAVHHQVGDILHALETDAAEATGKIRTVGQHLQRSNLPDPAEITSLLRDAPRFEMPALTGAIHLGAWKLLGSKAEHNRLLSALHSSIQPLLHQELTAYSSALGKWARQLSRDLSFTLESFAGTYRTSLQQTQNSPGGDIDLSETRRAVTSLLEAG